MVLFCSHAAFSIRHTLSYDFPSDPHTGLNILGQNRGHTHVGLPPTLILQMDLGGEEHLVPRLQAPGSKSQCT